MRIAESDYIGGYKGCVKELTRGKEGVSRLGLVCFNGTQGKPDIVHNLGGVMTGPTLFWDVVSPGNMVDLEFWSDVGEDVLEEVVNDNDIALVVMALGNVTNGIKGSENSGLKHFVLKERRLAMFMRAVDNLVDEEEHGVALSQRGLRERR